MGWLGRLRGTCGSSSELRQGWCIENTDVGDHANYAGVSRVSLVSLPESVCGSPIVDVDTRQFLEQGCERTPDSCTSRHCAVDPGNRRREGRIPSFPTPSGSGGVLRKQSKNRPRAATLIGTRIGDKALPADDSVELAWALFACFSWSWFFGKRVRENLADSFSWTQPTVKLPR